MIPPNTGELHAKLQGFTDLHGNDKPANFHMHSGKRPTQRQIGVDLSGESKNEF